MGTRHLIAVVDKNEKVKVAQYGQWDGYLGGQGLTILNFLRKISIEHFAEQLQKTSFLQEKSIEKINAELREKNKSVSELYPELSRDTSAEILDMIYETKKKVRLIKDIEFAGDSLFCEFAYVIDLSKNTFEVYEGFQKKPLSKEERFYKYFDKKQEYRTEKYYPVKKIAEFPLDKLPTDKKFLALEKEEEE